MGVLQCDCPGLLRRDCSVLGRDRVAWVCVAECLHGFAEEFRFHRFAETIDGFGLFEDSDFEEE